MAKSRRFVIDACIARAAGITQHPTSTNCRRCLEAVRDHDHRMVLTLAIAEEWNRHQSGLARRWRVSMHARKAIDMIEDPTNTNLRHRIEKAAPNAEVSQIILKDVHLIEAAITTDNRILSIETRAFDHLSPLAHGFKELAGLMVVDPNQAESKPIEWIESGAQDRASFRLARRS